MRSSPSPPKMMSAPPFPSIVSCPPSPTMQSAAGVPLSVLSLASPTITFRPELLQNATGSGADALRALATTAIGSSDGASSPTRQPPIATPSPTTKPPQRTDPPRCRILASLSQAAIYGEQQQLIHQLGCVINGQWLHVVILLRLETGGR